ncbi:MAG: hypothetical protein DHS20C01_05830 [marine bacterium B5-7]|nr:MAG: hypothetical protein DHS20C01_05830 [marine bacterium B5-7]
MKINIEIDISPEELRRFLGLPDVTAIQQELMEEIRKRVTDGVTDYDPVKLMEPFLTGNLKSFETMQNLFWKSMKDVGSKSGDSDKEKP